MKRGQLLGMRRRCISFFLKLEVTQALGVDNNRHIIWGERIILPPLVLNEEPIEANEDEEGSTFDVSVERRP